MSRWVSTNQSVELTADVYSCNTFIIFNANGEYICHTLNVKKRYRFEREAWGVISRKTAFGGRGDDMVNPVRYVVNQRYCFEAFSIA